MIGFMSNFRAIIKDARQDAREQALEESDLRWQLKILPVLRQVDNTFAGIANELIRNHCADDIVDPFNDSWSELKRLIRNIQEENNHEEQKNELEK